MKERYKYEDTDSKPVNEKKVSKELNVETMLEMDNIVEHLSDIKKQELAQEVKEGYEADKKSRAMREERMKAAMRLAMQEREEKTEPWEGCANVILPLITTAAMQFAARAVTSIIDDGIVAKTKVIGNDDGIPQPALDPFGQPVVNPETGLPEIEMVGAGRKKAKGDRRSDFLNWQLMEQSENWEDDTDRLLHVLPVTGNVYRKWHWSDDKPISGLIFPKNFIVDYFTTDLSKARKTQEFVLYPWEIEERIRTGQYIKFKLGEDDNLADDMVADTRQEGEEETGSEDTAPHAMIEQHLRIDLDNDGYPEPYIATVHLGSETLVRLRANYEYDGISFTDETKTEIAKIKEEVYFTKYGFIPSPDGSFYDLGFGELLFNLNESANSLINRLLDAGTLASTSSGFVGRGMKLKGGKIKVGIGEFPVIDTRGGSIRDNFVQLQHPEPSRVLFELLGTLIEMAKDITFSNKIMEGEGGNIPVGTVLQMVEQGLTGYKAIHKRVRRSIKKELKVLSRLNELNLDEGVYREVLDIPEGGVKEDFIDSDFDIVPVADDTMLTNSQRIARSQVIAQYKDDPRVDGAKLLEDIFEAVGADKKLVIGNPAPQSDPMVEMQKMMIQTEQYKAQIKEQSEQAKTQREAMKLQMEAQKAEHQAALDQIKAEAKAQADQLSAQIKAQEAQFKIEKLMQELAIKQAEGQTKDNKTTAEIVKINKQIELLEQQRQLELVKAQNAMAESQQKAEKESREKEEKKESSKELAEAVKSLKSDKKKILIEKKPDGSITGEIS